MRTQESEHIKLKESFLGSMKSLNHASELLNHMSIQPRSAKAVHEQSKLFNEHLKYEREKAVRAREVDDSIISMSEQQKKNKQLP